MEAFDEVTVRKKIFGLQAKCKALCTLYAECKISGLRWLR